MIGSNILQFVGASFEEDGGDPDEGNLLKHIKEVYSNEIQAEPSVMRSGLVRIKDPVVIPGRSLKQIKAKVPPAKSGVCFNAMMERHEATIQTLPKELL